MDSNARLIEEKNGLQFPLPGDVKAGWQKEWYHVCILAPGLDVIVNLNASADTRPAAAPGVRVSRLVLMSHRRAWDGAVETVDPRLVRLIPGEVTMRLGQNEFVFRDGKFELVAALQASPLLVEAQLQPQSTPLGVTHEVKVGEGSIGWFAIPRLAVSGRAVIGDRAYSLDGATAYHDHNWGHWLWGQDFSWEWGFGHLTGGGQEWSVIYDRTLNRSRTRLAEATFALWQGNAMVKIFSRGEITVRPLSYANPRKLFRIPRPLALAAPELGRDVPYQFEVTARSGGDHLNLRLTVASEAQILIPNETDLGTTIITEVLSQVEISGEVRGARIAAAGRGVFEFLST